MNHETVTVLSAFDLAAILVVMAAIFGFINHKFFRLPHTMGLTIMGAMLSLAAIGLDFVMPSIGVSATIRGMLENIDFHETLMDGMLSFLLFAGALHVELEALLKRRWAVLIMASLGVLISTFIVGYGFYALTGVFGISVPLAWCLVFGALISPTDPVAVMGVLKRAGVPPTVEAKIAGESLFNDGIGVVVFSIILSMAVSGAGFDPVNAGKLFVLEALGGAALGLAIGWGGFQMMKRIDEHNLEILITLAIVMGGYALAHKLHVAGPVAMAVAGLLIGNLGTRYAMSQHTREHLTLFWELLDEILNSVLFLLIGMEVIALAGNANYIMAGVPSILLVLFARAAAVGIPITILSRFRTFSKGAIPLLWWGGLRGGISIALALSLPAGEIKDVILTVTYVIVIFSVLIQGGTVGLVAKRFVASKEDMAEEDAAGH